MTESAAKQELRALIDRATQVVAAAGGGVEPFRGTALYDSGKDETFTSVAEFASAKNAIASLPLVEQRYGLDEATRLTLQFVYEWFGRLAEPHLDEAVFEQLWDDFAAELHEPDWVYRAIANVRSFSADGNYYELGDGVTIRGRSFVHLRALGFDESLLAALTDDWGGFGASAYVMVVETRVAKSPDNFVLANTPQQLTNAWRALGALRLLAPGDTSIGRMWMARAARFNVGLGGLQAAGFPIPAIGTAYRLTEAIASQVPRMMAALRHLEEHGYGASPGNLDLALRSFMATYDRWPPGGDSKILDAITAIEAVLGSGIEISFKLSFRVAGILGGDAAERAAIFREMKAYYDLRSKLVHGASLKEKHRELLMDTERLRHLVRELLRGFVHLATTPGHSYAKQWFQEELDTALQIEEERVALREALNLGSSGLFRPRPQVR